MHHPIEFDLTGMRFGRLVALSYTPGAYKPKKGGLWTCICDCGNTVDVLGGNLRSGNTTSCGCFKSEITTKRNTKHNGANTKLYLVWFSIKMRCQNQKDRGYKNYGARGINIYPEWDNDFSKFRDYVIGVLGLKPSSDYSLDRIDNNGNYEPGNLRWASPKEQNRNTRSNRFLTYNGQTKTISEWSEISGIGTSTISARIKKSGWCVKDAIETKPASGRNNHGPRQTKNSLS